MPTPKPRAAADDDIFDLTDLGTPGAKDAGDNGPADLSFENELDDLFGDVTPSSAKPTAHIPDGAGDDDALDMTGLGLDDDGGGGKDAGEGDDALDLAGFDLDDGGDPGGDGDALDLTGLELDAPTADESDDDALDLAGLDLDEPASDAGDDALDLAGFDLDAEDGKGDADALDLDGLELADDAPAAGTAVAGDDALDLGDMDFGESEPSGGALDLGGLETDDALAGEADGDALDLGGLDAGAGLDAGLDAELDALDEPEFAAADTGLALGDMDEGALDAAPAEPEADDLLADDGSLDVSGMDLDGLLDDDEAQASPPLPAVDEDAITDDLLDTLPEAPPVPKPASAPADAGLSEAAAAAGIAAAGVAVAGVAAMAAKGEPSAPAKSDEINLAALDELIDTAKSGHPEAGADSPGTLAAIAALSDRLTALETAAAALAEKFDALPPPADEEFLASTLALRLEDALAARFEPLLAGAKAAPDLDGLKAGLIGELRQELPPAGDLVHKADMAEAMDSLRAAIARLEALSQARQTQFADFAASLETRVAEMRRELPVAEDLVSPQIFSSALDGLRKSLAADFAEVLEARLAGVVEAARQAAREEVAALGETLGARIDALEAGSGDAQKVAARLETLESRQLDPEALTERVRDSLAPDFAEKAALDEVARAAANAEKIAGDALAGLETRPGAEELDAAMGTLRGEMASVSEAAAHTAEEAISSLGDALTARLKALETQRIDPESLAERVRSALLKQLPDAEEFKATAETATRAETAANEALARLETKVGGEDLDAALTPLRDEVGRTADVAGQLARNEVQALGDALNDRLNTLETQSIDPESLAQRIRNAVLSELPDASAVQQASETAVRAETVANDALARLGTKLNIEALEGALKALRDEIIKEIERIVPGAAASIIRQEINALAKELI